MTTKTYCPSESWDRRWEVPKVTESEVVGDAFMYQAMKAERSGDLTLASIFRDAASECYDKAASQERAERIMRGDHRKEGQSGGSVTA